MQTINQQLVSRRKSATLVLVAIATVAISVGHGQTQVVNNSTGQYPQQQQQQPAAAAVPLQAQLGQIQQQAQRQLSQLNGLVMKAVNNSSGRYSNVLEAISSVGKVIHQQISAATNPNHVNIVTGNGATDGAGSNMVGQIGESANSKKNEYQSIQMQGTELGGPNSYGGPVPPPPPMMMMMNSNGSSISQGNANYREQGEFLRQEITRRAGQLQQVVASSMELLKNNGDMIMRRLLEQMNVRLDQAKAKADKIISNEPLAMNEVTVKALATINTGLNNLNNIIANIVARMDLANKQDQQQQRNSQGGGAGSGVGGPLTLQQRLQQAASDPASGGQLLDTSRLKANLQQLSQQFQQALNGSSLHQQLALIRQQRLQQLAALGGGNSVVGSSNQQRASPPTTDLLSNRNNNPTAQDQQQPAQAQYNQQQ